MQTDWEWTADEFVLIIDAHHRIKAGDDPKKVVGETAKEIGCGEGAAEATIESLAVPGMRSKILELLLAPLPNGDGLLTNPQWPRTEADKVRRKP